MAHPELSALLSMIRRTLEKVSIPIQDELWKRHEPSDDPINEHMVRRRISLEMLCIGHRLAMADGRVANSELKLLKDIISEVEPSFISFPDEDILEMAVRMRNIALDHGVTAGQHFRLLLTEHDKEYGTRYCTQFSNMLFRVATTIAKADGSECTAEERELRLLKSELFDERLGIDLEATSNKEEPPRVAAKKSQPESIDALIRELESLVGLDAVKSEVSQLVNFLRIQQVRASKGMPSIPVSRHLVLSGNPGTGKTTVARLIARIYHSLGILSQGHLIETDRAGMVAGFVGQTAIKVKEIVKSSIGGVLFIDEAYALAGSGQDYGQEAIDTLLKHMEDNRDNLIVVVAGYPEKMAGFIDSNPGLRSRFNKNLHFVDYSPKELLEIFELFCKGSGFRLSPNARSKVGQLFAGLYEVRDATFGNARVARNLFEQVISHQANRIVSLPKITNSILETIESADIPGAEEGHTESRTRSQTSLQNLTEVASNSNKSENESIRFLCPSCGKGIKVPFKLAGKAAACPNCDTRIVVPSSKGQDGVSMLW